MFFVHIFTCPCVVIRSVCCNDYENKALLCVSNMNLLISYLNSHSCVTFEDLQVEVSRISEFLLLTFNKALFLFMCVRFPCVHTIESHNEIAHSECLCIVKYLVG